MSLGPQLIITDDGIVPVRNKALAGKISVRLPGGINYPKGQLLGEVQVVARNEVHTITLGGATGGSYRILFPDGELTPPIAFNGNAAAIQAAITTALGNGVAGNTPVVVTGTGPFVLTYSGREYTNRELALPQIVPAVTGGTGPSIALTTRGSAGPVGNFAAYNDSISDGRDVARAVLIHAVQTELSGRIKTQFGVAEDITAEAWASGDFLAADVVGLDANAVADLGKLVSGATFATAGAIVRIV